MSHESIVQKSNVYLYSINQNSNMYDETGFIHPRQPIKIYSLLQMHLFNIGSTIIHEVDKANHTSCRLVEFCSSIEKKWSSLFFCCSCCNLHICFCFISDWYSEKHTFLIRLKKYDQDIKRNHSVFSVKIGS